MQGTCVNIELVYMQCQHYGAPFITNLHEHQREKCLCTNAAVEGVHCELSEISRAPGSSKELIGIQITGKGKWGIVTLSIILILSLSLNFLHSSSDRIHFVLGWHFLSSSHTLSRIVFLWGLLLLKTHAMLNNPYTHNRARIMRIILRVIVMVSGFFQETGREHGHCSYNSWWHLDHPRHSASPGTLTLVRYEIIQRVWRDLSLENQYYNYTYSGTPPRVILEL